MTRRRITNNPVRPALGGAAVFFAGIVLACAGDSSPRIDSSSPDVLASFDGGVVTRQDFDEFPRAEFEGTNETGQEADRDPRIEVIREIAIRSVLLGETPDDDSRLQAAQQEAVDGALQNAYLATLGLNRITASEPEARAQYDAHPEQYVDPQKLRVQFIYLRSDADEDSPSERADVRQRLDEIRQEILRGADFSAMARQHSQSSKARSGGWLTLKPDSKVFPAFAETAWSLELGEISEVVETPTGFHLIRATERIPPIERPFDDVIQFARKRVVTEKAQAIKEEFVREAGERHGLVTRYERLEDPMIGDDEALVEIGDFRFTFKELVEQIPEQYSQLLFNRLFDAAQRFLFDVSFNRLLLLEAQRLELEKNEGVARRIQAAVDEVSINYALTKRMGKWGERLTDDELREHYWQNEERYQTMRTTDLSVMVLPIEDDTPLYETMRKARKLVERIRAGESFEELARRHSHHFSADDGGKMLELTNPGIARWVQSRANFRRMLNDLEVGELSDPIAAECYDSDRLRYINTGIIFVRKDRDLPPQKPLYEDVKGMVRWNYLRRNYSAIEAAVKQEIVDSIELKVYHDRLPPL